jgi:hypothetical protein
VSHKRTVIFIVSMLLALTGLEGNPVVGEWLTVDETTGQATSIVVIESAEDGHLQGRVVEILQSEKGPDPLCEKCPGARKNQPIKGMVILWGFEMDEDQRYTGGKILEPKTGKIYRAWLQLREDGTLKVRGFIGISLIGRTQVWEPVN